MDHLTKSKPWLPYLAPFIVYMAFLLGQSNGNLPWMYPLKTLAVAGTLWVFRREYPELRPRFSFLAVLVGLVVIALWIGLDQFYPKSNELLNSLEMALSRWLNSPPPTGMPATPFDPTTIEPAAARQAFIWFRVVGAVLVVPVMEELFWRGFLIRWVDAEDFKSVPVGTFTLKSFLVTTLLFGAEHDQWLAGLIGGALYNWLLYRTRSIWACIIAHAVSNAVLAGWVLTRGDWRFW